MLTPKLSESVLWIQFLEVISKLPPRSLSAIKRDDSIVCVTQGRVGGRKHSENKSPQNVKGCPCEPAHETINLFSSLPHLCLCYAKSLQSCPTLCDPIDGSPPGSPVPGILQARTLEWGAISFSNAWKWKEKVESLSRVRLLATPWTAAYQAPPSMGFSRQESGVGCHCLPSVPTRADFLSHFLIAKSVVQLTSWK